MTRWLVTRPRPDAQTLAATLGEMGHTAIVSPVIVVKQLKFSPIDWSRFDAIIFTSSNGVVLGGKFPPPALSLPVFTVGDRTAAAARDAGFVTVSSANGNVDTLARTLAGLPRRAPDRYVHICGRQTKGNLQDALSATGAKVETVAVYDVQPAAALTGKAVRGFQAGTVDGAIFLSPKTAQAFVQLAGSANIGVMGQDFVFAVISNATGAELSGLGGQVKVAEHPDLGSVLALLH